MRVSNAMTERGWLRLRSLTHLLRPIGPRATRRKLVLLAVAWWRRLIPLFQKSARGEAGHILGLAEGFADGELPADAVRRYWPPTQALGDPLVLQLVYCFIEDPEDTSGLAAKLQAVYALHAQEVWARHNRVPPRGPEARAFGAGERQAQAGLARDIFGNPFRPVTFSPALRTDTARALARQMYESRDFSAMPSLADALQDAGCEDGQVLGHCRGDGPHVRGCWVVDLVLGKE